MTSNRQGWLARWGWVNNALLFAPVDRFRRIAPSGTSSVTYFHKYYCICIAHDQIKLALLAAIIARHQSQARTQEHLFGLALGLIAKHLFVGQRTHGAGSSAGEGASVPS